MAPFNYMGKSYDYVMPDDFKNIKTIEISKMRNLRQGALLIDFREIAQSCDEDKVGTKGYGELDKESERQNFFDKFLQAMLRHRVINAQEADVYSASAVNDFTESNGDRLAITVMLAEVIRDGVRGLKFKTDPNLYNWRDWSNIKFVNENRNKNISTGDGHIKGSLDKVPYIQKNLRTNVIA